MDVNFSYLCRMSLPVMLIGLKINRLLCFPLFIWDLLDWNYLTKLFTKVLILKTMTPSKLRLSIPTSSSDPISNGKDCYSNWIIWNMTTIEEPVSSARMLPKKIAPHLVSHLIKLKIMILTLGKIRIQMYCMAQEKIAKL